MQEQPILANEEGAPEHLPQSEGLVWRICRALFISYLVICLLMVILERSLVYHPPTPLPNYQEAKDLGGEEVWFEAEDGTKLHGWFYAHPNPQYAMLYAHGNGEDSERNAQFMAHLRDKLQASVFIFDYRGYGLSEGKPHEEGVIQDGLAAQRWLAERMNVATKQIVLYGRSLGGGVMVALAEQLGAKALIVQGSFANMTDVGADRYFWLPVRLLMQNRFPSEQRIKNYNGPFLQFHGTADSIVPMRLAKPLFEASPSQYKRFVEVPGGTHNDRTTVDILNSVTEFLEKLPSD